MTSRGLALGLSLTAGLVLGLVFHSQVTRLRRDQRRDVWLAYVRGPLKLYVQGSRAGAGVLGMAGPWTRGRGAALDAAGKALEVSAAQAAQERPDFEQDVFFDALDRVVDEHQAAGKEAEAWPQLKPGSRQAGHEALRLAEQTRRAIAAGVGLQWARADDDDWGLAPSERAESLVMLEALRQPLF